MRPLAGLRLLDFDDHFAAGVDFSGVGDDLRPLSPVLIVRQTGPQPGVLLNEHLVTCGANSSTPTGSMPTRYSSDLISWGTPTIMAGSSLNDSRKASSYSHDKADRMILAAASSCRGVSREGIGKRMERANRASLRGQAALAVIANALLVLRQVPGVAGRRERHFAHQLLDVVVDVQAVVGQANGAGQSRGLHPPDHRRGPGFVRPAPGPGTGRRRRLRR